VKIFFTLLLSIAGFVILNQAIASPNSLPKTQQATSQPIAKTISPKAALERLFTAKKFESDWFAPEILAKVAFPKLQESLLNSREQAFAKVGSYKGIQVDGDKYQVIFERTKVPVKIRLDSKGRILELDFSSN
jgi:hypothetical protein